MPNFLPAEPPARHYTPDLLGGVCGECGTPIPAALAGTLEHPTCDPDWPILAAAAARAIRLRESSPNRT